MTSSEIFELVRPQCVHLTKSVESIDKNDIVILKKVIQSVNIEKITFQELQEYLLFPLRLILRTNKRSDIIIEVLDLMKYIFENTVVNAWNMFIDIFMQLLILISSPKKQIEVLDVCEELKILTLKCLQSLISHVSLYVMEQMYKYDFYLPLSHVIYISLQLIENEASRDIKIAALEVITALLEPKDVDCILSLAGNKFATFLPGITSLLTKTVTSDFHQGQIIIVNIIKVLQKLITLTVGDENLHNSCIVTDDFVKNLNVPNIKRNEDWIKTTSENLKILIKKLVCLVCHSHWKVRLALVEFSECLLLKCTSSLQNCISSILEILLILSVDDYSEVLDKSNAVLKEFTKYNINKNNRNILDILEDDLHNLVIRLPRIMKTEDEKHILSSLNLLLGYLNIFGVHITHFLHSLPHQKRIILALLHVAELENNSLIDEVVSQTSIFEFDHHQWPKKTFKYFRSDQISERFYRICHTFGRNGDVLLLVDCFIDKLETPIYCKQSILILNELLLGVQFNSEEMDTSDKEHLIEIINMIMETYLSSNLFNAKVNNFTNSKEDSLSAEVIKSNIQQQCLLLEGISNIAKVLGKDFQQFLIQSIYPLLEKCGSSSTAVSISAVLTLRSISENCGYQTLPSLITQNADYLLNMLSLRLRHFSDSQSAITVLQVSLQLCNEDMLPIMEDTINESLHILDIHHRETPLLFVKFCYVLVMVIKSWHKSSVLEENNQNNDEISKREQICNEVWESFLDYHKNKQISEQFDTVESNEDTMEGNEVLKKESNSETPLHIKIIIQVLQRCINLQSSKDLKARLLCLDTISYAIIIAKNYEDDLLPMVHNLWGSFVHRFSNDDLLVFMKAFETLLIMAECCGSFIYQRTIKDIWPNIIKFLKKQYKISLGKEENSPYKFTVGYKLQMKLLTELGSLSVKLNIFEKDLRLVLVAIQPYLSHKQPRSLQEAAITTFKFLEKINADAIWLFLNNLYSPQSELSPPHPSFYPIYFSEPNKEYKEAVQLLL